MKETWSSEDMKTKHSLLQKDIQNRPEVKLKQSTSAKLNVLCKKYNWVLSKKEKLAWRLFLFGV